MTLLNCDFSPNYVATEEIWLWHLRVTSDLSSDRSTWTCRCPSSSTRPPVRTPTAPAPQETTRCSPTTRCLTSPVFPNSFPATGRFGHKTRGLSVHLLSLFVSNNHTERTNSACNTSAVLQLLSLSILSSLFRLLLLPPLRRLFKHRRIIFFCWTMFALFFFFSSSEMKLYFCTRASLLLRTVCGAKPFCAYWDLTSWDWKEDEEEEGTKGIGLCCSRLDFGLCDWTLPSQSEDAQQKGSWTF